MNSAARLSQAEALFVFAHELLHAGLNHASRRRGRDPLLWNVACDFLINAWLIDMGVGTPPALGLLHDTALAAHSVEEVYDLLARDPRPAPCAQARHAARPRPAGYVGRGAGRSLSGCRGIWSVATPPPMTADGWSRNACWSASRSKGGAATCCNSC